MPHDKVHKAKGGGYTVGRKKERLSKKRANKQAEAIYLHNHHIKRKSK